MPALHKERLHDTGCALQTYGCFLLLNKSVSVANYYLCQRGNVFASFCLFVCLSVCLSVC